MEKTVLQAFTEMNAFVSQAEENLDAARNCLDQLAAKFGFVSQPVPLPVRGPNPYEEFPSFTPAPVEG